MSSLLLTQRLLAADQVALGDVVLNKDLPWNDSRTLECILYIGSDVSVTSDKVAAVAANSGNTNFEAHAQQILGLELSRNEGIFQILRDTPTRCIQLHNQSDKFKKTFLAKEENKEWLEDNMVVGNSPAYMVVGLYVLGNAQMTQIRAAFGGESGLANAPPPTNVGGSGSMMNSDFSAIAYNAIGPRILAIEYRQVLLKRRRFSFKTKIDAALLERNNFWKSFVGPGQEQRTAIEGEAGEQESNDDDEIECYEADLVEVLEPLDIEDIEG